MNVHQILVQMEIALITTTNLSVSASMDGLVNSVMYQSMSVTVCPVRMEDSAMTKKGNTAVLACMVMEAQIARSILMTVHHLPAEMVQHAMILWVNTLVPVLLATQARTVKQTLMNVLHPPAKIWEHVWMVKIVILAIAVVDTLEQIVNLKLMNARAHLARMVEYVRIWSMDTFASVHQELLVSLLSYLHHLMIESEVLPDP